MNRLHQWRRWIRPLVMVVYGMLLIVALPLMIVEFNRLETKVYIRLWFIGGMFVLLALPISLWGILQHLVHYTEPTLQRYIIRILWMVPIYTINAWFALKFPESAIYLDSARECYEAYVIYNFMNYLLSYLRSDHPDLEDYIETKPQLKHLPPICCLPPWKMGKDLIENCRHGVMQYTVLRPVTTFIAFACAMAGDEYYGEGQFNFRSAWSYLIVINNISQIFAMYCLVLFYKATRIELAPIKPVAKFMCVKAVVFLSFWQSMLIAILVSTGAVHLDLGYGNKSSDSKVSSALQDFCICIEMFIAAVAHYFSFSHRPFVDFATGSVDCFESFKSMWDVSDVQKDVVDHIRHVGQTASSVLISPLHAGRPVRVGVGVGGSEMTPLLNGSDEPHPPTSPAAISDEDDLKNTIKRNENGFVKSRSTTTTTDEKEKTDVESSSLLMTFESFDADVVTTNPLNGHRTTITIKPDVHNAEDTDLLISLTSKEANLDES